MSKGTFEDAIVARDAKLDEIARLPAKERNRVSAVVGGVSVKSGQTAVGIKKSGEGYGKCAEDLCVEALGGTPQDVLMSPASRPRTGDIIPVCKRCQTKYAKDQFPPETPFEE